jgi:hypothetical protein
MKTLLFKQFAPGCLLPIIASVFVFPVNSARGQCAAEVLFGPTETQIVVRVETAFEVPDAPDFLQICSYQSGEPFFWEADFVELQSPFFGDGSPGLNISFFSGLLEQNVSVFIPNSYITNHGTFAITSDPVFPPDGVDGVDWTFSHSESFPMSVEGSLSYDPQSNVASVSLTFSAGEFPTPAEQISDLIEFIEGAGIDEGVENALIAGLEAALASVNAGDVETAEDQLNAFINKVEAVRGKKISNELADELISAAEGILASLG